ncbi:MAG: hypothetical protein M3217_02520 [Actinomycetota bacterium]|nr:hypothetical protein [Actinomycetota bacterium]
MSVVPFGACVLVAWLLQAVWVSRLMDRRGFDPASWFVTSLALGPAAWVLALGEARHPPPGPVVVRWGTPRTGVLDVFVGLDRNELPDETRAQLRRVMPYCRRLVVARVVKAGSPAHKAQDARQFLVYAAERLLLAEAELQLLYGDVDGVVGRIQARGEFGIILRSDRPAELFDGDGSRQEVRCRRDVPAV